MNLQVPSNLCNKLMGVTVCAIFVLRQHRPFPQLNSLFNWSSYRATHRLRCSLISDRFRFVSSDFCFSEEFGEVESYPLLQNYYPIVQSFNEEWKEKLSQADVDIFKQIEIEFTPIGLGLEVMKCGGRLIFQQDIEDLNQTMRSGDDCDGTSGECTSFNKAHCINHFKGRPEVKAVVSVAGKGHHWIGRLKKSIVIDYEPYTFSLVT